jgi:Pyridoxamine 5'-phosphate oxidase
MGTRQGDLTLLQDPVAQELLHSRVPARLAYKWLDDSPRVIPIWFHWTGDEVVLGTPPRAPKLKALPANPTVALSIDSDSWPYRVLQIRGTARVEMVEGVMPEYELAAQRYFGPEQGRAWIEQVRNMSPVMGRIAIRPEWVAILDFETRFPSALSG